MEKYTINIEYGLESLEELIIKSMVKELVYIIRNNELNKYDETNYEYKK